MKMETKKVTKEQLQRRLDRAVIHIDRTSECKEIYFDDKGLRLTVTNDFCIIGTNFHRHVYNRLTSSGYSRPYLYVKQFAEMALANDCVVKDESGNPTHSYAKFIENLSKKADKKEYNLAIYCDWFLFNIFTPLYSIGEDAVSSFVVYFHYLHNIACNHIILDEHKEGMTNKEFVKEYRDLMDKYLENVTEMPIFEAISDEERAKREMDAMEAQESDEFEKRGKK